MEYDLMYLAKFIEKLSNNFKYLKLLEAFETENLLSILQASLFLTAEENLSGSARKIVEKSKELGYF
jgi:hypothetical protein